MMSHTIEPTNDWVFAAKRSSSWQLWLWRHQRDILAIWGGGICDVKRFSGGWSAHERLRHLLQSAVRGPGQQSISPLTAV